MIKNIVLIGMTDSEKTTIGKIVSDKLGFKFLNADKEKEENDLTKMINTRNECIDTIESEVVQILINGDSSVISTKVDLIKNHLNIKELKDNAIIIFIEKFSEKNVKDEEKLNNEIFKKYCDLHLINNNCIDEIVEYICYLWGYKAAF